LVKINLTTRRYIPEDSRLQINIVFWRPYFHLNCTIKLPVFCDHFIYPLQCSLFFRQSTV
jgi:hypothetical protein